MNSQRFLKNSDATWRPEHVLYRLREITLLRRFKSKNNPAYKEIYIFFPKVTLGVQPASDPHSIVSKNPQYKDADVMDVEAPDPEFADTAEALSATPGWVNRM